MKKVLITGAGSYIGTSFEKWVKENCPEIETETLDVQNDAWRETDFGGYDAIFHVAGIAHADTGHVSEERQKLYYKVNCDLAVETAKKAKAEGVKQFIYMSSIIVYGESAGLGKQKVITRETPVNPANFYGDSKVQAEKGLFALNDDNSFAVVILRPPMIYGKGAKGNYPLLAKMAKKLPLFPNVMNQRSMLYIENLCQFISLMIENEEKGVFFPQNEEYVQTSRMVQAIAEAHGKKIHLTGAFNWAIWFLGKIGGKFGGLANKAFGNIVYDKELSVYKTSYQLFSLDESICRTEKE